MVAILGLVVLFLVLLHYLEECSHILLMQDAAYPAHHSLTPTGRTFPAPHEHAHSPEPSQI